jgi:hypothetical protein
MPKLIAMVQTTWPHIRVGLYEQDGLFQYTEEGYPPDKTEKERIRYNESGWYDDLETAKKAMVEFYCFGVEDKYWVEPDSVTILEAPDFKGPHHPKLHLGYPPDDLS